MLVSGTFMLSAGIVSADSHEKEDGGSTPVFPIELSVTEIPLDDEIHYAAFIRDVSDKRNLQELLMEKERLSVIGATIACWGASQRGNSPS